MVKYSALIMLMVLLSACSQVGVNYRAQLKQVQRSAEVFDFDTLRAQLVWNAVHVTDEMRAARLQQEAQLRHLSTSDTKQFIPELWNEEQTVFYIGFFAPPAAKSLDADDAYWRLELTDGSGTRHAPMRLERAAVTPLDRKLFPELTPWSEAYYAVFPKTAARDLRLTLYGLNATSTLTW